MYFFIPGNLEKRVNSVSRANVQNTHFLGFATQSLLLTDPNNVIDRKLITKNDFLSTVAVDYSIQTSLVNSEIIKKSTVLPESVMIVGIVHTGFIIALKQDQAGADSFF
jgi:hypothetical protein